MARKPLRPCSAPGCGQPTSGRYCSKHKGYADAGRPSAAVRGYGHRWRKYRLMFLRRHPICEDASGCEELSTDVDHKTPISGPDDPRFWDPTNHQALCHEHHSAKTARENGGFGRAATHRGRGRPQRNEAPG